MAPRVDLWRLLAASGERLALFLYLMAGGPPCCWLGWVNPGLGGRG